MTDWASMDNSPRNSYLAKGGTSVDTSSQMVLFARQLAEMSDVLGRKQEAAVLRGEGERLARLINQEMWDSQRRFYFDLTVEGKRAPAKTVAAFWTLLAGVASPEQADALAAELRNPASFGRLHRVPTTPADQTGFDPAGGYWCGAVWAPTNTMVIRGLEKYGKHALAQEIALEHLQTVGKVFKTTGTVWENYAPDAPKPGKPAKRDFVGWTGIVPILYFLEYAIGLKPDAPNNRLTWTLATAKRCGCKRFRFNGHTVTLVADPAAGQPETTQITVDADGGFHLTVRRRGATGEFSVKPGRQTFLLKPRKDRTADRVSPKGLPVISVSPLVLQHPPRGE
jgi:glycogen debranching enzyme